MSLLALKVLLVFLKCISSSDGRALSHAELLLNLVNALLILLEQHVQLIHVHVVHGRLVVGQVRVNRPRSMSIWIRSGLLLRSGAHIVLRTQSLQILHGGNLEVWI